MVVNNSPLNAFQTNHFRLAIMDPTFKKKKYKNKLPFVENIVYRQKIMVKENSPYIHKCSYLPQNKSSFQTLNI